jgi:drug/metabolite transporter (DMT)-like permease
MTRLSRAQQGIVLVIVAMACFAVLDGMAKYLGTLVPLVVAMWFRYMFQMTITGAVLLPRRGRSLFKTRHPWLQALRGVSLAVSSSLAFLSLQYMPVAEFTAILTLTPMVITLVSVQAMGERVSWLRWLLLAGGLVGAMMVIQPDAHDFQWVMLLPLALVLVSTGFQLLTSYLVRHDDPGTMHFLTGAVACVMASIALPFFWQTPSGVSLWLMVCLLGVLSTLGHYLMILAYSLASPATLTPYLYFQIAFATLAGWLVFSQVPDRWSMLGIGMIAACGVASSWLAGPKTSGPVENEPTL